MWSKTIRVGLLTLTFLFTGCASDTDSDVEDAGTSSARPDTSREGMSDSVIEEGSQEHAHMMESIDHAICVLRATEGERN